LDSVFTHLLKEAHLLCKYKLIMLKDHRMVNSIRLDLNSRFAVSTKVIPVNIEKSISVQAVMMSPYKNILGKMALMLIATAVMFLLVMYCIVYQVKIIIRQKKIAAVREDISYAMVHDMKTPLSSILMGAHVLRSGKLEDKPEKKVRYFSIIEEETQRLLLLINKILTISKLEDGKLKLQKTWVDMSTLVPLIYENFKLKANKEATISYDLKVKKVFADEEYFKEVVENIIDNAFKYSKPKAVHIEISSENDEERDLIVVRIKDDGMGMSDDDQRVIFDKFERASAINRTKQGGATGFGLGLNYVYQVMKAHGGKIEVHSEKGKYSEFVLSFPT
jgi:two-component system phosphate regulon sensor histidine kinase PhoR